MFLDSVMRGWSYNVLYVYRRTTSANDDDESDVTGAGVYTVYFRNLLSRLRFGLSPLEPTKFWATSKTKRALARSLCADDCILIDFDPSICASCVLIRLTENKALTRPIIMHSNRPTPITIRDRSN